MASKIVGFTSAAAKSANIASGRISASAASKLPSGGGSSSSNSVAKTVSGGSNPNSLTTSQVKAIQKANGLAQDGIIGPKTQAVLNKTSSSSSSDPARNITPASNSSAPGPDFTNKRLLVGDNGSDTSALQSYLNSQGANIAVDGKFGPATQAALKDFQSKNGLVADGIIGPNTAAVIKSGGNATTTPSVTSPTVPLVPTPTPTPTVSGNSVTFNGQTYTTSSPEEASFLQNAIVPFLDQLKQQGMAINPDLNLGPDVIAKILTKAQDTVHPQFQQQIENVKQDLARNVGRATDSYNSSVAGARQNFQDLLGNTRENYAGSGLAFSGQRGLGETNLANDENRSLASLSSNYGNTLGDYARGAEQSLGTAGYNASGFQLPNSTAYSADLSGNGGFNSSGNVNMGYTPGSYALGSIPQSETAATLALRNQNVQQASNLKSAGLDYSSLYA